MMDHTYRTNAIARPVRPGFWRHMVVLMISILPFAGRRNDWRWYRRLLGGYWYMAWVEESEVCAKLTWCGPYVEPQDETDALVEGRDAWPTTPLTTKSHQGRLLTATGLRGGGGFWVGVLAASRKRSKPLGH